MLQVLQPILDPTFSEHSYGFRPGRSASESESHTRARYRKFAVEADDEGWRGVASLFRAAAYAEQIHAGNHGRILRQLGGETELFPQPVEVRGTWRT